MRNPSDKVLSLVEAQRWRNRCRDLRQRVVVTNGCFDLLHRGHVEYLVAARREGDALLVAINSDRSVAELKGDHRPLVREQDRVVIVAALEAVDAVVLFPEKRVTNVLRQISPDVYVKGGDYTLATLDPEEYSCLQECGCTIRFIPFVNGYSTTSFIAKVRSVE